MICLDIILGVACIGLPIAVLTYDKVKYRRWYARKAKLIFLRENTKGIRDKLEGEDIKLCKCASFDGNVWLSIDSDGVIHGMGLPYEGMEDLSPKEICAFDIQEARDRGKLIVDCGTDLKKFIKEVKRYGL